MSNYNTEAYSTFDLIENFEERAKQACQFKGYYFQSHRPPLVHVYDERYRVDTTLQDVIVNGWIKHYMAWHRIN